MNTVREIQRINEQELERGIAGTRASWHSQYAKSAWVFVGNLDHVLTEGDVVCVLSQYGELEDLHLVRDDDTGKSRGFAFGKYQDARSCILAVDNFCGMELCGRTVRVDHVENYRLPKNLQEQEGESGATTSDLTKAGKAYEGQELANKYTLENGQDLFAPVRDDSDSHSSGDDAEKKQAKRKRKEERQQKRDEKERRRREKERRKSEKEEKKREKR